MKRATPGIKRKKAISVRKPASPRTRPESKSKLATKKNPAKKSKKIAQPKKQTVKKATPPKRKSRRSVRKAALKVVKPAKRVAQTSSRRPAAKKRSQTKATRTKTKIPTPIKAKKSRLPAFLLEGDEPSLLTEAGSAEKFALGPTAPPDHFDEGNAPLPASYGTGRLFLTARDPHWLYANWDFTAEEQFRHNARSVDRHLIIRLHSQTQPEKPPHEIHVHPESKHWFVHVEKAGESYSTELGYYQTGRRWKSLARSAAQRTPPGNISSDSTVTFATIPMELSFETMLAMLRETANENDQNIPLARAIESIRMKTKDIFPDAGDFCEWTREQAEELDSILTSARTNVHLPNSDDASEMGNAINREYGFSSGEVFSTVTSFMGEENNSSSGFQQIASPDE